MREQLRTILAAHKLTTAQAAEMLGKHPITVRKWSAGIEPTPTWAVELLAYKLNDRREATDSQKSKPT